MKKTLLAIIASLSLAVTAHAASGPVQVNRVDGTHIQPLVTSDYFQADHINASSTTATSTFAGATIFGTSTFSYPNTVTQNPGVLISGTGNSSTTSSFMIQNKDGNEFFRTTDDGIIKMAYGTSSNSTNSAHLDFFPLVDWPSEGNSSMLELPYIIYGDRSQRTLRLGVSNDFYTRAEIELSNLNSASGTIAFKTANGNGGAVERMRVDQNGHVGIATTTPWAALSVEGISTLGNQAIAGYFNATSSVATSTLAGNLTLGSSTTYFPSLLAPSFGAGVQIDDPNANCTANGNTTQVTVYPYTLFNGITYIGTLAGRNINVSDNNDSQSFRWTFSWGAVDGATGYLVAIYQDSSCNGSVNVMFDNGNSTSADYDATDQSFVPLDLAPALPTKIYYPNNFIASTTTYLKGRVYLGTFSTTTDPGDRPLQGAVNLYYMGSDDSIDGSPGENGDGAGKLTIQSNSGYGAQIQILNPDQNSLTTAIAFCGGGCHQASTTFSKAGYVQYTDDKSQVWGVGLGNDSRATSTFAVESLKGNNDYNSGFSIDGKTNNVAIGALNLPFLTSNGRFLLDLDANNGTSFTGGISSSWKNADIGDSANNSWLIDYNGSTTISSLALTGLAGNLAGSFLAVDRNGKVIATTTPASGGTNYFTNSGVSTVLTTGTNLGIGTTTPYGLISASSSSATPAFVARSLGGGGDLYDGYDSSGTLRFRVASNGALSDTFSFNQTGSSNFTSSGFSGVPVTIMGASGQTANLTQWQNNSGFNLSEVNSMGFHGIGTSTPWAMLSVSGTSTAQTLPIFVVATSTGSASSTALIVTANGNVGIATSTPWAPLSVVGNTTPVFVIATSTTSNSSMPVFEVDKNGHQITSGPTPTVSGGTSSVAGNDNNGTITVTGTLLTSVTMTFANAWAAAPDCIASDNSLAFNTDPTSISTTQVVFGFTASVSSGTVWYQCVQHQ